MQSIALSFFVSIFVKNDLAPHGKISNQKNGVN